jgi:hypothetical protein
MFVGGFVWIGRAAQGLFDPDYWNPRTTFDYLAVVGTSIQWLLLSAILWGVYRKYPLPASYKQRIWQIGIIIAVVSAIVVSVSNFVEDAIDISSFGSMYVYSSFGLILGLLLAEIGALLHTNVRVRFGWLIFACFLGGFDHFGGGFITGFTFLVMGWQEGRYQVAPST